MLQCVFISYLCEPSKGINPQTTVFSFGGKRWHSYDVWCCCSRDLQNLFLLPLSHKLLVCPASERCIRAQRWLHFPSLSIWQRFCFHLCCKRLEQTVGFYFSLLIFCSLFIASRLERNRSETAFVKYTVRIRHLTSHASFRLKVQLACYECNYLYIFMGFWMLHAQRTP